MIIVVDGNIGSGKSTLLRNLSSKFTVVPEKIHDWPLEEFYKDPTRWAFALQVKILQTMPRPTCSGIVIHERCPQSSNFVLWKHLVDKGKVSATEDKIYQDLYAGMEWKSDVYIYMRCSPEKCFQNIHRRVQVGDTGITFEYIKSMHEKYENYVKQIPNVIIIDAEQDETQVYNNVCGIIGCLRPST
jgi:deoxyadenosine/deoxycytidine kinase